MGELIGVDGRIKLTSSTELMAALKTRIESCSEWADSPHHATFATSQLRRSLRVPLLPRRLTYCREQNQLKRKEAMRAAALQLLVEPMTSKKLGCDLQR